MASTSKKLPPPRSRRRFPSPRIPPKRFPFDVFLSFRGLDTRNSFTDHLYTALTDSGIHTFMDDDELNAGGSIQQQLMMAIEESRIAIVIFSINYASSSWCLDELVRIIDCKITTGKIVLPVFYHVDPADVRWQMKSFAEVFENHQVRYANEMDKVEGWRSALSYAADLSGLSLHHFNGSESKLIKQILKEVLFRGNVKKLFVARHPVGLDSRLNVLIPLLEPASEDVRLLGIYGMGGIGKTVIATVLYNETLRYFDSSCFLENIREVSARPNGLETLQERLLYQLSMKTTGLKVVSVRRGTEMIKEMFRNKKILIVLDDLENHEQAEALAASHGWFGPGSRIIITTRHEKLLHDVEVDATYLPGELNYDESLELVSLHSFKSKSPTEDYTVPANNLTDYCQGLPLALQVLGSFLSGKTVQEWNSAIESLQKIQPKDIHEKLKISYDGLNYEEKEIFLDIAYFFIGMDIDYVTEILNGCGFKTTIGIKVLRERCLITINRNNELRMHDLLRDMGKEIIRRTFLDEPCNRSRLWIPIDDTDIQYGNKEANAVKGVLIAPEKEIHLQAKTFSRMPNLRLLRVGKDVNLQGRFCYLSPKIRWICWQEYPLNDLPRELVLSNIVALDMQRSKMCLMNIQFMELLTNLNLSHSKRLRSTPDFKKVPALVTLVLEGCTSLQVIHPSIGCLGCLVFLNLKDCTEIKTIPSELCRLKSLEDLNLNGCSKLEALPENLGEIKTLRALSADETAIKQLPSSLGLLENLMILSLKGCNKKSENNQRSWFSFFASRDNFPPPIFLPHCISGLSALKRLILRDCNLSYRDIPVDIGSLSALQVLDLAGNSFSRLPQSFNQLTNLESLCLDNWNDLCSLPEIPSNLKNLLRKAPQRSCRHDVFLSFAGLNTRDTFTDHLYTALVNAGIQTFRDDEVNAGGITSHEMMPAMEESRIATIVLSTDYACSTWCLDHLVRIIECRQSKAKLLLPIFYGVDQTDVSSQMRTDFRYSPSGEASQRGSFAYAFQLHKVLYGEESDMVERWRCGLSYIAGLRGFSLQDFNGNESRLISHIVKEVQWELKRLFVGKHLVGLESRLEEVRRGLQLRSKSDSVCKIVIYGAVGSGKTVMAKALYNESLKHFESSCFLENVGAVLGRPEGDVYLQNQLLNQLGKGENGVVVSSVEEGNEVIEKRCGHKKVLVVVDGLDDHIQQGNVLLANRNRYGPGSRIIVTTCSISSIDGLDDHFQQGIALLANCRRYGRGSRIIVTSSSLDYDHDEMYGTKELNWKESVELLSWHSFGNTSLPTDDHIMLAGELSYYCFGNPLAVVVLGKYLCGRSIPEWKNAVRRKHQIRAGEINEIEVLIDGGSLRRPPESAFLKVAYIIQIFKGSGVNSDIGTQFLLDRYFRNYILSDASKLVKIHESLQRMGFPPPYPIRTVKDRGKRNIFHFQT